MSPATFEKLISDVEHHIDFLGTQLDFGSTVGVELYSQHQIGELAESGS